MLTTYGDISPRTAAKSSRRMLDVMQPKLLTQRFAQPEEALEKNRGRIVKWRRYLPLPPATAPLAEGVTPSGSRPRYQDYQCVLQEYGDYVEISDVIEDTHEDPVLKIYTTRCGEQAAQTVELATIDILKGGTNAFFANGQTARTSVVTPANRGDLRRVVRAFDRANAEPIGEIISPSGKISTSGVESAFFAMAHTDLDPDLRGLTGFKSVIEYGNPDQAIDCEVGACERIRFCLTPNFLPWEAAGGNSATMLVNGSTPSGSTAVDVYPMIIVAKDSYGSVRLQGLGKVQMFVHNANKADKSDILGQRGYVGWKLWYGAQILNDSWLARLEVACTANPT